RVEADVLGHALAERFPRHVPRELEERDALLRAHSRAPAHVAVDVGADLRALEIRLARRVEEAPGGEGLDDLHEAAVDLARLEMEGAQSRPPGKPDAGRHPLTHGLGY